MRCRLATRSSCAPRPHNSCASGLADAAPILLVIERAAPERYERTGMCWVAKLASEADVDLATIAAAATALKALPQEPGARRQLAEVCRAAGLVNAAEVFLPAVT